jgi:acetyl esterase
MAVDPAFADILGNPRMALRPLPPHLDMDVWRRAANGFMGAAKGPRIAAVKDLSAQGPTGAIPVRLYQATEQSHQPLIFFVHGGGFVFGSLDSHDGLCRALAFHSGATVASVGYRLVPEAHFPQPLDDCIAALRSLLEMAATIGLDPTRVAVVGDSAGAQLAVATAISVPDLLPVIRHMGLFYPLIDPACDMTSAREFGEGFMLTRSFLTWCWHLYAGEAALGDNALFDLTRADVRGLPSTTIVTAEFDPLRDEGEAFGACLRNAGSCVTVSRYEGMIHGFAGFLDRTPLADKAIREVAQACRKAFAQ